MFKNVAPGGCHISKKMRSPKIESILFVPSKLTFSENLRLLNLDLLVGAVSQKRSLSSTCFVIAVQNIHSVKSNILNILRMSTLKGQIVSIQF